LAALISLAHHNRDQDALAIGALYEQACSSVVGGVQALLAAGRGLIEKKARLGKRGRWLLWLEENHDLLGFETRRTAARLMKVASEWDASVPLSKADAVEISRRMWGHDTVRGTTGTGENEWFTPEQYVEAARSVLGEIDLDPASHAVAQQTVLAARFFTREDDSLCRDWHGRVWLNPPYARDEIGRFVDKLIAEIECGNTTAAIMLTHNYTDTEWFHAAVPAASAVCFTLGRVRFVKLDGSLANPTQGQAFFYYGSDVDAFMSRFAQFGLGFVPYQHPGRLMVAA
jgi:phage N-6-adenine-methyltransferase